MRPEEKCVSLETARKLKAAGFPQDTERWYMEGGTLLSADDIDGGHYHVEVDEGLFTAAPDSAELGELLPKGSIFVRCAGGWMDVTEGMPPSDGNVNEAECRAAAYLYLKENNLL